MQLAHQHPGFILFVLIHTKNKYIYKKKSKQKNNSGVTSTEKSSSSTRDTETDQWLNIFQMKTMLGMTSLPDDDELLVAELNRYEQRDHPNPIWAQRGQKEYHFIEKKSQKTEGHTHDHQVARSLDAKKAKVLPNSNETDATTPVKVDWKKAVKTLCKSVKTQMEKGQKAMGGSKKVRAKVKKSGKLQDLVDKISEAESKFNNKMDEWTEKLSVLEESTPNEETNMALKTLFEEMKDTTTVFEAGLETASQAAIEVDKSEAES